MLLSRVALLRVSALRSPAAACYMLVAVPHRRIGSDSGASRPTKVDSKAASTVSPAAKPPLTTRVWRKVKEEAHHYWVGTKLLGSNMRVSFKLLLRVARGEILSRRERNLLEITVADTLRLFPFLVIAAIPFLEFALPFILRIFPNLLPSTYTTSEQVKVKQNASLKIRLEMAKFLQSATSRMVEDDEVTEETAREFLDRASKGLPVTNKEIIRIGKVLKSEFDLSNIGLEQLQAAARFFGVTPFGPKTYIVYMLERKLKSLRKDDQLIAHEGLEKLTLSELTEANFKRGMHVEGRTREQLEQQLEDWMELADSEDVPPFLLLLSRSFSTESDTKITQEAFGKLAASERLEELLEVLPDRGDLYERKLNEVTAAEGVSHDRSDLSSTFDLVDSDHDGTIDAVELKILMQRLGETFPQQQIDSWLKAADTNHDGEIDFKEFVSVMRTAIENADGDIPLDGVEKEVIRIRNDILRARKESARKTVTPLKSVEQRIRSTVASLVDTVEKELKATVISALEPPSSSSSSSSEAKPDSASKAETAESKPSHVHVNKKQHKLWQRPELWESDERGPTSKQ